MLIAAILTWGHDLLIRSITSIAQVKDWKHRLNWEGTDIIVYDSGYLTLLRLDDIPQQLDEEHIIELFGNPAHRRAKWDRGKSR